VISKSNPDSQHEIARVVEQFAATRIDSAFNRLAVWSMYLAVLALISIVGVQAWQVFARYVLNDTPDWTEPASSLLLVTLMSFSAAAGVQQQSHFRFDLLLQKCGADWAQRLNVMVQLLVVASSAVLAIAAFRLYADGLAIKQAGVAWSQGMNYLPLAIACILMCLFSLQHFRKALASAKAPLEQAHPGASP
jgi:TRAP-type C4-dicarboxylate transport system permease small subunit